MDAPQTLLLNLGDSCRVPFARTEGKGAIFFLSAVRRMENARPFCFVPAFGHVTHEGNESDFFSLRGPMHVSPDTRGISLFLCFVLCLSLSITCWLLSPERVSTANKRILDIARGKESNKQTKRGAPLAGSTFTISRRASRRMLPNFTFRHSLKLP